MKRFFIGVMKATLGFLIALTLVAAISSYLSLKRIAEREKEKEIQQETKKKLFSLKDWGEKEAGLLGLKGSLKTKWDGGYMRYLFQISGIQKERASELFFVMKDQDGFNTYVHSLKSDKFWAVYNDAGEIIAQKCEGIVNSTDLSEDFYLRTSVWEFRWNAYVEPEDLPKDH
jgi:hypothetical protein